MFSRMMSLDKLRAASRRPAVADRGNIAFALPLPCVKGLTEAYMKQSSIDAGLDAEAVDAMETVVAYFTEIGAILDARAATLPAGASAAAVAGPDGRHRQQRAGAAGGCQVVPPQRAPCAWPRRWSKSPPRACCLTRTAGGRSAIRGQLTAIQNAVKEPEMKKAVAQIAASLPQR